jgi:predicted dehydrogenase
MTARLRVGVIGLGGIAAAHMPGWLTNPDTEVVAGCDVNSETMATWGQRYNVTQLSTNPGDIFSNPDIDIVDICTPNNYHAPLAIAAMRAGKHVLCEKPLAPNPALIREMIAARDETGKLLMTAQHMRFGGIAKAMKAEIDGGTLGNIYHARGWMLRRALAPTRPGFILKEQATGGACIDIGVHVLDLMLWFMSHPKPVSVSGVARTELAHQPGAININGSAIPPEMDVEEFATAFVRFDNGATLLLEVSWLLHHNTAGEDMQIWLYGTDGGSHFPKAEFYNTNRQTRQFYNRALQQTADIRPPHTQECFEFADAVLNGKPSPVPAEHSLHVLSILDAIYQSQASGREVMLA